MLKAYINGTELGRKEEHTPFTNLLGISYDRRSGKVSVVRDESNSTSVWPQIEDRLVKASQVFYQHLHPYSSFLSVSAAHDAGLDVHVANIPLRTTPIAVSLSREWQPGDKQEMCMVVLEYPSTTKIDESLENEAFRKRFPVLKVFSDKKVTMSAPDGNRVLMIAKEENLRELWRDHKNIRQTFVVGSSEEVDACHLALTEGRLFRF